MGRLRKGCDNGERTGASSARLNVKSDEGLLHESPQRRIWAPRSVGAITGNYLHVRPFVVIETFVGQASLQDHGAVG